MKLFVKIIAIISSLFLTAGLCSCGSEKPDSEPIIESVTENENNEEIAEEHTESETESNTDQDYAQDEKEDTITVPENDVSDEQDVETEVEKKPTENNGDGANSEESNVGLFDFEFQINGVGYKLPQSIDKFTQNGWAFPDNFTSYNDPIQAKGLKETYLENGENWFAIEVFNNTDNIKEFKDCPIGRVTYDFSGDIEIVLSGDFKLNGKTLDDVKSRYGEPFSQKDYSTYTEIIYDKDPSKGTYDRYVLRFDLETKSIKNFDVTYFYG